MKHITRKVWVTVLVFLVVAAVIFALLYFRPWEMAVFRLGQNAEPFTADKYKPVQVIEDSLTPFEKINPLHRTTRAEELLADKPAGTEVYEFEVEGPPQRIWRTPTGEIYIEKDSEITEITAYRKPEPSVGLEFRPVGGAWAGSGIGAFAGVDVLRVCGVHTGPVVAYDANGNEWSGGANISYNALRNVDIGTYVGYGEGVEGGVTVGIAIE